MFGVKEKETWRGGVYLCTCNSTFEADLLESKLRSENIPCVKKYKGAGNYMEIFMGTDVMFPIDLYVPEECLEDAKNVIVAVPLEECEDAEDIIGDQWKADRTEDGGRKIK